MDIRIVLYHTCTILEHPILYFRNRVRRVGLHRQSFFISLIPYTSTLFYDRVSLLTHTRFRHLPFEYHDPYLSNKSNLPSVHASHLLRTSYSLRAVRRFSLSTRTSAVVNLTSTMYVPKASSSSSTSSLVLLVNASSTS